MEGEIVIVDTKIKKHMTRILCVLGAIALWLFVTYTEDPEMELWLRDIPLSYMNTESLAEKNLTILKSETPEHINVKVRGRRSSLMSVQNEDVYLSVDYSSIDGAGDYALPINAQITKQDLRVVKQSVETIPMSLDAVVTVEKAIHVTSSGAEPLGIREFTPSPASVRVTGSKMLLEQLQAVIHIDLREKKAAPNYKVTLQSPSNISFTSDQLFIENETVSISAIRALPVSLEAANIPDTVELERVECTPETVEIRGTLEDILAPDKISGSYAAWVGFGSSPSVSGNIPLVYPDNVEVLGETYAAAKFYFHQK